MLQWLRVPLQVPTPGIGLHAAQLLVLVPSTKHQAFGCLALFSHSIDPSSVCPSIHPPIPIHPHSSIHPANPSIHPSIHPLVHSLIHPPIPTLSSPSCSLQPKTLSLNRPPCSHPYLHPSPSPAVLDSLDAHQLSNRPPRRRYSLPFVLPDAAVDRPSLVSRSPLVDPEPLCFGRLSSLRLSDAKDGLATTERCFA